MTHPVADDEHPLPVVGAGPDAEPVNVTVTGGVPPTVAGAAMLLPPPVASSQDVIQQQTSTQDYVVLRFAVVGLLAGIVLSLLGVLILAGFDKDSPEGILSIGSACVGALATMLVRPPLFPPTRPPTQPMPGDRRQV